MVDVEDESSSSELDLSASVPQASNSAHSHSSVRPGAPRLFELIASFSLEHSMGVMEAFAADKS